MLPKKKRLSKAAFNRFFSTGKKKHTKHFLFVHAPHESFHASVVVPKKVVRTAAKRNRVRRRIYDILRNQEKQTGATGVFILIAKESVTESAYKNLQEEISNIITQKTS